MTEINLGKTKQTFRELLAAFDIAELWYILSMRHELPPLRAERLFRAYQDARKEMLELPISVNKGDTLHCELFISKEDGGAPMTGFSCTIACAGDTERYGFELTDWAELVDCEVDGDCVQKYGALIVTAELLWEMTFAGFDRETVLSNAKQILGDDKFEFSKSEEDALSEYEARDSQSEPYVKEWFINAPDNVKREIIGTLKVHALDKLDYEVSDKEFMAKINARIKESTYEYKGCDTAVSLIYSMLKSLDYDDMAYLAQLLENKI